jgi:hypothetical protein
LRDCTNLSKDTCGQSEENGNERELHVCLSENLLDTRIIVEGEEDEEEENGLKIDLTDRLGNSGRLGTWQVIKGFWR